MMAVAQSGIFSAVTLQLMGQTGSCTDTRTLSVRHKRAVFASWNIHCFATHGSTSVICLQLFFSVTYSILLLACREEMGWVLSCCSSGVSRAETRVRTFLSLVTALNELDLFLFIRLPLFMYILLSHHSLLCP